MQLSSDIIPATLAIRTVSKQRHNQSTPGRGEMVQSQRFFCRSNFRRPGILKFVFLGGSLQFARTLSCQERKLSMSANSSMRVASFVSRRRIISLNLQENRRPSIEQSPEST